MRYLRPQRGLPSLALALVAGLLFVPAFSARKPKKPDYPHGAYEEDCLLCHDSEGWTPARISPEFDHGKSGYFALLGAHARTDCVACHVSLDFAMADRACVSCHMDVHLGELGTDCETCHTSTSFIDRFRMTQFHMTTRFPLRGAHRVTDCESCHELAPQGQLQFVNTQSDCAACHLDDYLATTEPDHQAGGFSTDCEACHGPYSWRQANFDHDLTAFPLVASHRAVDCAECHTNGFAGTPTDCAACHLDDYQAASDPNHADAGFPTDCEQCHQPTTWDQGTFEHDLTAFPLTGSHVPLPCSDCHASGFAGTPTDCASCHLDDYQAVTDPDHVAAGFSTDCETCHTTSTWGGANFDHNTATTFELVGSHLPLLCSDCHASGYTGTPTTCDACHLDDYQASVDPDHAAAGFPTDCELCHAVTTWDQGTFEHDLTAFPLTGSHVPLTCSDCHASGYAGTPTNCDACHLSDYQSTIDPDHQAAGYPLDCSICHTTTRWPGAQDVNHDPLYFPIYSGTHFGRWDTCSDCHMTPTNFMAFECIFCHPHSDRVETDGHHQGISGYRYESQACYACHPRGTK